MKPLGYIVLDEGSPVRRYEYGGEVHYWNNIRSRFPVAVFSTLKIARIAKSVLRRKYRGFANDHDPFLGDDSKRCHNLWVKRAKDLRISAIKCAPEVKHG